MVRTLDCLVATRICHDRPRFDSIGKPHALTLSLDTYLGVIIFFKSIIDLVTSLRSSQIIIVG